MHWGVCVHVHLHFAWQALILSTAVTNASVWPVKCFWYMSLTCTLHGWGQWDLGHIQKWCWRPIVLLSPWWRVHVFFIQETQCPLDPVLCQDWQEETMVLAIDSLQPRPCSVTTSSFPVSLCLHQRSLGGNVVLNKSPHYSAQHTGHNWDSLSWLL